MEAEQILKLLPLLQNSYEGNIELEWKHDKDSEIDNLLKCKLYTFYNKYLKFVNFQMISGPTEVSLLRPQCSSGWPQSVELI